MPNLIGLACLSGACGAIGWLIGHGRGRGVDGVVLGGLLGPLGWLIVAVLPATARAAARRQAEIDRERAKPSAR